MAVRNLVLAGIVLLGLMAVFVPMVLAGMR